MSSDLERRFTQVRVEVRAGSDGPPVIGGYAAKFNKMSQNLGGFVERIDPAFFNKSRGDGWPGVVARYNHDDNMLLGTIGGGSLRLSVDEIGLPYEVDINTEDPSAVAAYARIKRGDVRQSSFAFEMFEDDWGTSDQGFPLRTLISGRLYDVAPVNTPAYEDTSVGLRSLARKFDAPVEEVRKLAEAGDLSRFFKRTDAPSVETQRRSAQAAYAKALTLDPNATL